MYYSVSVGQKSMAAHLTTSVIYATQSVGVMMTAVEWQYRGREC